MDLGDVLLPYQKAWLGDKSPVKVVEKSRRIGLTWAQALDDVLKASTSGRDGMDVLYISFNQDMTREYIDTCAEWAKKLQIVAGKVNEDIFRDGDEREIKAFRIDFASGHKILALSNRPSNLRGKQGRVIIDEAAFVEDLPELLKAALALLMWGGQVIIISTHDGAENPFNELIQDVRAGNLPYSLHRITLDDALSAGLYRRICRVTKQDWTPEAEEAWRADLIKTYGDGADEELFCIPRQSSGAYLTTSMIEACMEAVPVLTWTPPAEDFVDWPLPVAERYTKGWMAEQLEHLLSGLPKDRGAFLRRGLRTQRRPFRILARDGRKGFAPCAAFCAGAAQLPAQNATADSFRRAGRLAAFFRRIAGRTGERFGPRGSSQAAIRAWPGSGSHDFRRLVSGDHAAAQSGNRGQDADFTEGRGHTFGFSQPARGQGRGPCA